MTSKSQRLVQTFILAAIVAFALPVTAFAQGNYDHYGRNRDYGRSGDYRRNNNYGYDQRLLRDSVRRVKDRSDDFRKHMDSALDHSRYDGRRREDRINDEVKNFRDAANRLKDRYDNGRNLNRSYGEASALLQIGVRIDRFISRNQLDGRVMSDWSSIRQDLRVIADVYGIRMNDFDDGYNRRDDGGYGGYRRRSSY